MLTGRQIREARRLIGWTDLLFCRCAMIDEDVLARAEAAEYEPDIASEELARIRRLCERLDVRFGQNGEVMRLGSGRSPAR